MGVLFMDIPIWKFLPLCTIPERKQVAHFLFVSEVIILMDMII